MSLQVTRVSEIAAGAVLVAGAAALGAWLIFRRRPTAQELELARRVFLTQSGRLVDGNLLEISQVTGDDGRTLTLLIYDYRIGGVDYQCAQDITDMTAVVDAGQIRAGFPCSVRYQPGHPQNSIVVAESWTGIRNKPPVFHPILGKPATAAEPRRLNGKA